LCADKFGLLRGGIFFKPSKDAEIQALTTQKVDSVAFDSEKLDMWLNFFYLQANPLWGHRANMMVTKYGYSMVVYLVEDKAQRETDKGALLMQETATAAIDRTLYIFVQKDLPE